MNNNGYSNLKFPTLLIEKVARLIDARTLQFPSVGDVFTPVVTYMESQYIMEHADENKVMACPTAHVINMDNQSKDVRLLWSM